MVVSFHPCIEAEVNLICAGREPGQEELAAIRAADAVILPQGCTRSLYRMARANCRRVFPNYDARFDYPGKTGQIRLFRKIGAAHPETRLYPDIGRCRRDFRGPSPAAFPLVFKFDWGGEGAGVFRFDRLEDLDPFLADRGAEPPSPCLVQAYVPGGHRSLRVAVVGRKMISYWRTAPSPEAFYPNLARGGAIDPDSNPVQQSAGRWAVRKLCDQTGINLAGVDLIFPQGPIQETPLFLEINYFFGRRGLGGSAAYYRLLEGHVHQWLAETGIR